MQNVSQMIAINYNNCLRINLIESLNFQIVLKDDETFAVGKIENWFNGYFLCVFMVNKVE